MKINMVKFELTYGDAKRLEEILLLFLADQKEKHDRLMLLNAEQEEKRDQHLSLLRVAHQLLREMGTDPETPEEKRERMKKVKELIEAQRLRAAGGEE